MMDVRLLPAPLRGAVTPPPSKSLLHRQLICLAQAGEFPCPPDPSDDVEATVRGLWALYHEKAPVIDCGASGSTLRFLLPLAMARGQVGTVFTGTGRLLERPLPGDWGLAATAGGLRVTRALSGGQIPVDGTRTSQLLSGLLMALPGLAADSELALTGPLASRPYVDLTLAVLRRCGVHIGQTDCGFTIPGGQRFRTVPLDAEPDWSAAAFWLAVRALGCAVAVTGLRRDSLQGDRAAAALCRCLPEEVDLTDIPDLLPPLALLAALRPGTETRFTGAARLRDKESDRLASVSAALTALGGRVRQEPGGLTVWGVERLSGGEADSCGDHRIAMLCACAAPFCTGPVVLRNAGQGFQFPSGYVAKSVGNLFRAANFQPLPCLDGFHKAGRLKQGLMGSRIQPSIAAGHGFYMERSLFQIQFVQIRNLQLAAGRRFQRFGFFHRRAVIEIEAGHCIMGPGMSRFLFQADRMMVLIKINHAIPLRIRHIISKNRCAPVFLHSSLQHTGKTISIENVVSQNQRTTFAIQEILSYEQSFRQPGWLTLHRIGNIKPPLGAIPQKSLEIFRIMGRRNHKDVPDTGQHEHA